MCCVHVVPINVVTNQKSAKARYPCTCTQARQVQRLSPDLGYEQMNTSDGRRSRDLHAAIVADVVMGRRGIGGKSMADASQRGGGMEGKGQKGPHNIIHTCHNINVCMLN